MTANADYYGAVCECGDYRRQHYDGIGKCGVCGDGLAPWDGCQRYRPTVLTQACPTFSKRKTYDRQRRL